MKTFDPDVVAIATDETKTKPYSNGHSTDSAEPPKGSVLPPTPIFLYSRKFKPTEVIGELKARNGFAWGVVALVAAASLVAFFLLRGSSKPAAPVQSATPVTVQTIVQKPVRLWSDFSARLQAVNYAEIRPEVTGRITEVRFEDGQTVKKGAVLFVIDPGPYEAALARAQANQQFAKTEFERADGLLKAQAIAQRLYDERQNALSVAQADVARAQIDVSRAYVKAPFTGRISRAEITVGNVVLSGINAPLLASIVSKDGIYADFEVDEQTYLQSIRDHANGRDQERSIPVELTVQGDKARVYKGSIYSFDNHLDTVSGTIRARAKFANEDGALMPGMFVSIKMGNSQETPAILAPERAIGVDQNKKFMYVVGRDNKVSYHEVTLGKSVGSDRVILSGIQAGDRVVVDGLQHVRPDSLVDPKEVAPAPAESPAPVASH